LLASGPGEKPRQRPSALVGARRGRPRSCHAAALASCRAAFVLDLISIRRGRIVSGFGIRSVNTPSDRDASIASGSRPSRHAHAALEPAEPALDAPDRTATVLASVRERPLTADRQQVVLELDLEVLRLQARNVYVDGHPVGVDQQIGRRNEGAHRALVVHHLTEPAQPGCQRLHQRRRH
jgi:hypothetical protein